MVWEEADGLLVLGGLGVEGVRVYLVVMRVCARGRGENVSGFG